MILKIIKDIIFLIGGILLIIALFSIPISLIIGLGESDIKFNISIPIQSLLYVCLPSSLLGISLLWISR